MYIVTSAEVRVSRDPGISLEIYEETLFGQTYPLLAYWQIGLRDLKAADYAGAAQDLAIEMMARGRAQGIEQEKRAAIVRLVRLHFRTVPADLPARLANLDAARLDLLLDKAEFADSLEEFLAAL